MKYNINKIPRRYRDTIYRVGDIIYPPCGYRPVDYIITGFIERKKYTSMIGYHTASKRKKAVIRGGWRNDEVEKLYDEL